MRAPRIPLSPSAPLGPPVLYIVMLRRFQRRPRALILPIGAEGGDPTRPDRGWVRPARTTSHATQRPIERRRGAVHVGPRRIASPRLTRTAPDVKSIFTFMASRTCDLPTLPGRAGGSRRDRYPVEVEGDQQAARRRRQAPRRREVLGRRGAARAEDDRASGAHAEQQPPRSGRAGSARPRRIPPPCREARAGGPEGRQGRHVLGPGALSPRSWPPPRSNGLAEPRQPDPEASTSALRRPAEPAELVTPTGGATSAPSAAAQQSTRPAACTASHSTKIAALCADEFRDRHATGWITPVSLLAACTASMTGSCRPRTSVPLQGGR